MTRVNRSIEQLRRGYVPKDFNGEYRLAPDRCPYLPGTPERILQFMYRQAHGLRLWHRDDARLQCAEAESQGIQGHKDNFGGLHHVTLAQQWSDGSVTVGASALPDFLIDFLRRLAVQRPTCLKEFPRRILDYLPLPAEPVRRRA